ncbi:histidine phosphatase family protein [Eilatimonas milleporae]|uniref:Alpha-ribazole phosphatase/probable phosphoglycerate mutase n=1 Tax=Eilatimonas milleporae TaxID=911205 RepID=A0A3M0C8U0_9PROT|nr:histidine phosphatase family protein [Eilatimonas milleporae]RMB04780.1 alpha-ribazole phosphatase/probable phosphoglycerate mutase [Eilatimonas milleporae]
MILLARHGQTDWNLDGRLQGRSNSAALTDKGRTQALALGAFLRDFPLPARSVFASPLERVRQSLALVTEKVDLGTIHTLDELAEIDFGQAEGRRLDTVQKMWPDFWMKRQTEKWTTLWPGGGSYAQAHDRFAPLAARLQAHRHETDSVTLVMAHQSVNRALLVAMNLTGIEQALKSEQDHATLYVISATGLERTDIGSEHPPEEYATKGIKGTADVP